MLSLDYKTEPMLIFHVDSHEVHRHYRQCVTFGSFPSLRHEMVYNLFCLTMLYVAPITIIVMSYGAIVITIVRKTKLTADVLEN
ncbi:hypothetical protein HAZT_HAZT009182 [Hyalella azteca]|uniref:G-protein coupled receptors family 1 profile domain-containing protein n=1 Tax=Hyalella azteca TaxID=294128 RepID=A0A6A0GNW1_HYAAZ|nr:hypothetical protein HAZT_HAZT009182 [Hyalella azteca]